jgi:methyl-accepting chemotaxis protein
MFYGNVRIKGAEGFSRKNSILFKRGIHPMNRDNNRRKLRNFLINPSFQLRLALIYIVFLGLVLAVIVATLLVPFYPGIHESKDLWMQYITAKITLILMDRVALLILIIVVMSIIYQIIFSHRVCGPLVNMNHTFDCLSKGDLTRKVFLRRKDFLKKEAENINGMVDALNKRVFMLKKVQTDLSSTVVHLPEGVLEDRLRTIIRQNQALLDEWTVDSDDPDAKNVHDSSIDLQNQA